MTPTTRHLADGAERPPCGARLSTSGPFMTSVPSKVTCLKCRVTLRFRNYVERYLGR